MARTLRGAARLPSACMQQGMARRVFQAGFFCLNQVLISAVNPLFNGTFVLVGRRACQLNIPLRHMLTLLRQAGIVMQTSQPGFWGYAALFFKSPD
ncbi:hypothetical protein [Pantoea sp. SGAir0183]